MALPIYYVGTPSEVEHHARPLQSEFDVRIENAEDVVRHAQPGDVCVFFNEFFSRFRLANHELVRKRCATLYAIDGILEWRSMWECPPGEACLWTGRPILSHKIACVGRSQARIFESWGNARQCEIVGIPRFDPLLGRSPRVRTPDEPFTILVLTAKWPGFNKEQWQLASQSLKDLKSWLDRRPMIAGVPIKSVWRITQGLESEVGVDNTLKDTTGQDLAAALQHVDAVITTPSTAMLEGMLQGVPVALLDYNNCPHYVPAAWRITAKAHFNKAMAELVTPPHAKMLYQQHLLRDALECASPALPRLAELIDRMGAMARRSVAEDRELTFPRRLLHSVDEPPAAEATAIDHERLFPANGLFGEDSLKRLQLEVDDLRNELVAADRRSLDKVQAIAALEQRLADKGLKRKVRRLRQKVRRAVHRLVVGTNDAAEQQRAA